MQFIRDDRPWGYFLKFPNNVKILAVKPGGSLSLQYHHHRDEYWYVLEGDAYVTLGKEELVLTKGQEIIIPQKTIHRLQAKESEVHVLEICSGIVDERDIVRLDDKYGRI